jgi:hypothetical protein
MAHTPAPLKQKLIAIIKNDYEDCQFYMASTHMLINKIKDLVTLMEKDDVEFDALRDEIGQIGIFLSNSEKRLEEVDQCYTKLVEALAGGKPKS